jgi:hypothetical protein
MGFDYVESTPLVMSLSYHTKEKHVIAGWGKINGCRKKLLKY